MFHFFFGNWFIHFLENATYINNLTRRAIMKLFHLHIHVFEIQLGVLILHLKCRKQNNQREFRKSGSGIEREKVPSSSQGK